MNHLTEVTLDYFQNTGVSGITKKSLQDRDLNGDTEISLAKATLALRGNYLELVFFANSTYGSSEYIAATDLPQPPNGKYTLALRFYGIKPFLNKDVLKQGYSQIENGVTSVFNSCDVKFYSDDPSFFFQGCWEGLDKNDMSIYKFPGPDGKGIWDLRHSVSGGLDNKEVHLTKHLAQLVDELSGFTRQIAQKMEIKR